MPPAAAQPMANCAIRITSVDGYDTTGSKLMGRQSANESFLQAWFQYAQQQDYYCLARFKREAQTFARVGEELHAKLSSVSHTKPVYRWIPQMTMHRLANVGSAFLPGPQVADMAWARRRDPQCQPTDFSLIGMTHTTCELAIQDNLANMLHAPVHPWDAQICPSQSVKRMVEQLLNDEASWVRERFGASRVPMPQLPVIPLGIHTQTFDPGEPQEAAWRAQWRNQWQLGPDDVCVLYMGRLDLKTKANLFPTFDALEVAAKRMAHTGKRLVLVLAGWFASDWNEATIKDGVLSACPSVRVVFEDGRPSATRQSIWFGADIFTSLVDNIQETFGLTPIEAMASGLPVVVTDYDGYKESVRDGQDGFRIRTWQPTAGSATDLVDLHNDVYDNYATYASRSSWFVGVDIEQAASAFESLALQPALRARMGQAARKHAQAQYSWQHLIPQYQQLFADLGKLRAQAQVKQHAVDQSFNPSHLLDVSQFAIPSQLGGTSAGAHVESNWHSDDTGNAQWGSRYPRRSDPFHSFSHYPTAHITPDLLLQPGTVLCSLEQQLTRPIYADGAQYLETDVLKQMLALVNQHQSRQQTGLTTRLLLEALAPEADMARQRVLMRQVAWLLKTGLVSAA